MTLIDTSLWLKRWSNRVLKRQYGFRCQVYVELTQTYENWTMLTVVSKHSKRRHSLPKKREGVRSTCWTDIRLKNWMTLTVAPDIQNDDTAHLKREGCQVDKLDWHRPKKLNDTNSCVWVIKMVVRPIQKSKRGQVSSVTNQISKLNGKTLKNWTTLIVASR